MKKIFRFFLLIGYLSGWFSFYYNSLTKRVKYSKTIHNICIIQFLVYLLIGSFGSEFLLHYELLKYDLLMSLFFTIHSFLQFFTMFIFYININYYQRHVVELINRAIDAHEKISKILKINFNDWRIELFFLKMLLIDSLFYLLKLWYDTKLQERMHLNYSIGRSILRNLVSVFLLNFLNFYSIYQIILNNLLNEVNSQLKSIFHSFIEIPKHFDELANIFYQISNHIRDCKAILSSILPLLYVNSLFNFFLQLYLVVRILISYSNDNSNRTLILCQSLTSAFIEFVNLLMSAHINTEVNSTVSLSSSSFIMISFRILSFMIV
jgi:hypothetical protein